MAVDWSRGDLYHSLRVQFIDPLNLTTLRGETSDVCGGSLDWDYYGDTRGGAEVELSGSPWDGSSAMRLVHTVSGWEGELLTEVLFTGYVTALDPGEETTRYTLASPLHGLETNVTPGAYSIAKSSKAKSVISHIMKIISRPYRFAATAHDYLYGGAVVEDAGTSYLSIVHGICDKANDRLTVDADGIAVIEGYTAPSQKTPDWDADPTDPRTTVIGKPVFSDNGLERPERVIVHAEKDDTTITVTAVAPSGSDTRHAVRGYYIDSYHEENDLSPFTSSAAQALANTYLKNELVLDMRCTHELMYRPLREGQIERLTWNGEKRRWQVASASLDLTTWVWSLDLKGGWLD